MSGDNYIANLIHFVNKNRTMSYRQSLRCNRLLTRDCTTVHKTPYRDVEGCAINAPVEVSKEKESEISQCSLADKSKGYLFGARHCPLKLVKFLILFTKDGSALKYTTHPWESGLFDSFNKFYEEYKKIIMNASFWKFNSEKGSEIFTCTPHLYQLINNFLFNTNEKYFWGNGYKIGYMTDNIVEKWMEANPGKQPYSMPVSEIPQGFIPVNEREKIVYFEDVVNVFKELIEFRGNKLYHTLRRTFTHPDLNVDKQLLSTLKGKSFYTDTDYVSKAIEAIASNIKSRHEYPIVEIYAEYRDIEGSSKKTIELHILHRDSFADCDIDSDKLMLRGKGGMLDIKKYLISLCDFSIISRFDVGGAKRAMRIDYLYDEDVDKAPRKIMCNEEAKGFEYILTFYES